MFKNIFKRISACIFRSFLVHKLPGPKLWGFHNASRIASYYESVRQLKHERTERSCGRLSCVCTYPYVRYNASDWSRYVIFRGIMDLKKRDNRPRSVRRSRKNRYNAALAVPAVHGPGEREDNIITLYCIVTRITHAGTVHIVVGRY